ncbi:hypothetical protein GIB67_001769 [Kingdonia uniflora]|uniref:Uncharacterized protein n=1 Tax=Kingdonia uniflora TaxID=39325 RepID=A0A7J7LBR2_9MAGN|nr:hypothetical protein GIB67_001769 [Kingdonia uniflora]
MPAEPADGGGSDLISFDGVPNCPVYPWWQLSPIYRSYKKGDPVSEFIRDVMLTNETSWGVVVNTFDELESVYLQHLEGKIGRGRVWAVGPIVPSGPTTDRGGSSKVVATELLSWLDKCQDNSVVYVCFGSQVVMSNLQMEVLALALEKSRVRFVWGVKEPTIENSGSEFGAVPPGFEDGVAGRGLVIRGWVPQVMVLNHRAVGSFLTHCGWNSVLEAIVAGVPMLAWPMGADQYTNAALLIEELRIAIKVCEGRDTVSNANEMAQAMADSLSENQSRKARVLELSRASLNAIQLGGNSSNSLDGFLKELAGLKSVNNSS